jgi:hypothetical protein
VGWLGRRFGRKAAVAYTTWHVGARADACGRCRELDGTSWVPDHSGMRGPPLREGCTCLGGCTCRTLVVRMDEAWGPGNSEWIRKRGGLVTGAQLDKFLAG